MTTKLIGAGVILALLAGLMFYAHHLGASSVQAKWDAQKRLDTIAVAKVEAASAEHARSLQAQFDALNVTYKDKLNEKPTSVADPIPAAVADGSLRLRDVTVCSGNVSATTASSRAADAATTQALADRVSHSIAAIRAGDAADERERQLDAQIIGLQDALSAERR